MSSAPTAGSGSWTAALRDRLSRTVPADQVLPDRQPAYVASWIYVFGVLTLAALIVVVGPGVVLAFGGSTWWHTSSLGHFVNSVHLWSVELFFVCMVIHLWGKFWMAAWRGHRGLTWVTGVVAFLTSIGDGVHRLPHRSPTSTPSGSAPRPRTASTPSGSAPGSTCSTRRRCCCGTSCCCRSPWA